MIVIASVRREIAYIYWPSPAAARNSQPASQISSSLIRIKCTFDLIENQTDYLSN